MSGVNTADLISLSLLPVVVGYVILHASKFPMGWLKAVAAVIFVLWSSEVLKVVIAHVFKKAPWALRPDGSRTCSLFCRPTQPKAPAFPSGHMALATFIVASVIMLHASSKGQWRIVVASAGLAYLVAMAYSRYAKHCHNTVQIIAGVLYGGSVAWALKTLI